LGDAAAANDGVVCILRPIGPAANLHTRHDTAPTQAGTNLIPWIEPVIYMVPAAGGCAALLLSRPVLQALVPHLADTCTCILPEASAALTLLFDYLEALKRRECPPAPELRHKVVTHVYDLAALVLGSCRNTGEIAQGGDPRKGRLQAFKDHIAAHLCEPDLSLQSVARHHQVSPRLVQKFFALEGVRFSDYVRAQRLARTHRLLRDPCMSHMSISTIAYKCGFGDIAAFNRVFRKHYHVSPSGIRYQAPIAA